MVQFNTYSLGLVLQLEETVSLDPSLGAHRLPHLSSTVIFRLFHLPALTSPLSRWRTCAFSSVTAVGPSQFRLLAESSRLAGHHLFPSLLQSQTGHCEYIAISLQPYFTLEVFSPPCIVSSAISLALPFQMILCWCPTIVAEEWPTELSPVAPPSVLLATCTSISLSFLTCHQPWQ